jgi:hypothetical protein
MERLRERGCGGGPEIDSGGMSRSQVRPSCSLVEVSRLLSRLLIINEWSQVSEIFVLTVSEFSIL